MTTLPQDVRYALRTLAKSPGFSAVAIATLALGIGANTAIFSVADSVLLRSLPYANPSRLAMVTMRQPRTTDEYPLSDADFLDWKADGRGFEEIAAFGSTGFNLTGPNRPEQIAGVVATAGFFSTLGVRPQIGRFFRPDEDRPGSEPVVVLGHALWQTLFGSDPGVVGRAITLEGKARTVIGVASPDFRFPGGNVQLWTNLALTPPSRRGPYYLFGVARLAPRTTMVQAQGAMDSLARRIAEQHPKTNSGVGFHVEPLQDAMVGEVRPALLALLAAVGFVLLIACVNVTNLVLARSASREREFAIRAALGASRARLVRQSLTETLLLAAAGGLGGLVLAYWGLGVLQALGPQGLPRLREIGLDGRVLAFAAGISLACGALFGLAPARQRKSGLSHALKEGKGSTAGPGRGRVRSALVTAEVALALVLLIGAGLMIKSFVRLQQVQTGIDPNDAVVLQIGLPWATYPDDAKMVAFFQELLRRVEALPGVRSAGLGISLPPDQLEITDSFTIEGDVPRDAQGLRVDVPLVFVSPGYFPALGIPLRRGRLFTDADAAAAPPVTLINETFARKYFPGGDPLGKRIRVGGEERPENAWMTVVGVVADVPYTGLNSPARPAFYGPLFQNPWRSISLIVRSGSRPESLLKSLRETVWSLDRDLPVARERTLQQMLFDSVAQPRFRTFLLTAFGAVGLLLASLGIYGVLSHSVAQRTREIGIRMALGAERSDVLALIVRQGMALALLGIMGGLAAAFGLTQLIASLLFGVQPRDALVFAAVPTILAAVAFLACLLPARRAMRVDPIHALRSE